MINENAAMYIGIVTACILDRCPAATIITEKTHSPDGYRVAGSVKGKQEGAVAQFAAHDFTEAQVRVASAKDLAFGARAAGDSVGSQLAAASGA